MLRARGKVKKLGYRGVAGDLAFFFRAVRTWFGHFVDKVKSVMECRWDVGDFGVGYQDALMTDDGFVRNFIDVL